MTNHTLANSMYCSCGQDACTCQVCGRQVCGNHTEWAAIPGRSFFGNICRTCLHTPTNTFSALKFGQS